MKKLPNDIQYYVPCPCGEKIAVRVTQAGESLRCACGAEVVVPSRRELQFLNHSAPNENRSPRRVASWTGRHRRIFIGCVVFAISMALFAWLRATQPRLIDFKQAPLDVAWPYWQQLRQGLDRYLSPAEYNLVEMTNRSQLLQVISFASALVGVILAAVSFVQHDGGLRRKRKG
ncbi:MAG: hypothetical protein ABFC63_07600 [Thermoguttaceae bacterium]